MNVQNLITAINAAIPTLSGEGVETLKVALAEYEAARAPQRVNASAIGAERADYEVCMRFLTQQTKSVTLSRAWYGSGDDGHAEDVLAHPWVPVPHDVFAAFNQMADAALETEQGLENNEGGSVVVTMNTAGLTFNVTYNGEIDQGTTLVVFDDDPATTQRAAG